MLIAASRPFATDPSLLGQRTTRLEIEIQLIVMLAGLFHPNALRRSGEPAVLHTRFKLLRLHLLTQFRRGKRRREIPIDGRISQFW